MESVIAAYADQSPVAEVLQGWLSGTDRGLAHWTLQALAASTVKPAATLAATLAQQLEKAPTPALLDALMQFDTKPMDGPLQALASDGKQPASLRLKALGVRQNAALNDETFQWVKGILQDTAASAAARIQAAGLLARSTSDKARLLQLAPLFASAGPVELKELTALLRGRLKDMDVAEAFTRALSSNPSLSSIQESVFRTLYASEQPALFDQTLLPAIQRAELALDAKKRLLSPLAAKAQQADPAAGKLVFESGQGSCIACHKIGDKGRAIGPDLSHIGAIRTERDLVESIVFPSNTLARDYEAHILELRTGENQICVIKSHTAEGLLVVDAAGVEKNLTHQDIVGDTTLTQSLMPMGLDLTVPEKSLLDLVAYLRSLK
jgi:putative heme-binding domain-containing protein